MSHIIISDLDGTLTNIMDEGPFETDEAYLAARARDQLTQLGRLVLEMPRVVLLTGRRLAYADATREWLAQQGVEQLPLISYRNDSISHNDMVRDKGLRFAKQLRMLDGYHPRPTRVMVLEDDDEVLDLYRKLSVDYSIDTRQGYNFTFVKVTKGVARFL